MRGPLPFLVAALSLAAQGDRAAAARTYPAVPARVAGGAFATGADEFAPALSPDGLLLVYTMSVPHSAAYVLLAATRRPDGGWTSPEVLPFSGSARDFDPTFSPDGRRLYFISDRAADGGRVGDYDVWVVERGAAGWGTPRRLPAPVNSPANEEHAVEVADGSLYFTSDRPGGLGAADVYRAQATAGGYATPVNLGAAINSVGAEMEVTVRPDERALVVSSWGRPGGDGSNDLYWSRRGPDGWTAARRFDSPINTAAREYGPAFTPDGRGLLFASERTERRRFAAGTPARAVRDAWGRTGSGWGDLFDVALPRELVFP